MSGRAGFSNGPIGTLMSLRIETQRIANTPLGARRSKSLRICRSIAVVSWSTSAVAWPRLVTLPAVEKIFDVATMITTNTATAIISSTNVKPRARLRLAAKRNRCATARLIAFERPPGRHGPARSFFFPLDALMP